MTNNMNVCLVAGTHGNPEEYLFGREVQRQVIAALPRINSYDSTICMMVGNERAVEQGVRYTPDGSDLNRAGDGNATGYEAERFEEIQEICQREGFTHFVDLHTSPTTHSTVPILPPQCEAPEAYELIHADPTITDIVKLAPFEKAYSVVAAFGKGGIALECPRYAQPVMARRVAQGLLNLMQGVDLPVLPRDIYRVDGVIPLNIELPTEPYDDFKALPAEVGDLAFVADPATYAAMGYGHQGLRVYHEQVQRI